MELVTFNTAMCNECYSINKLFYNKDNPSIEMLRMLTDYFGLDNLQKTNKFGICASYRIQYQPGGPIKSCNIIGAVMYIGKYKIQIKNNRGVESLSNILNDPIITVHDEGDLQKISEYLFNNTSLPNFLLTEVEYDISRLNVGIASRH